MLLKICVKTLADPWFKNLLRLQVTLDKGNRAFKAIDRGKIIVAKQRETSQVLTPEKTRKRRQLRVVCGIGCDFQCNRFCLN